MKQKLIVWDEESELTDEQMDKISQLAQEKVLMKQMSYMEAAVAAMGRPLTGAEWKAAKLYFRTGEPIERFVAHLQTRDEK